MKYLKPRFLFLILFFSINSILSQKEQSNIQEKYSDYFLTPREVSFLHLNKSTFIVGEDLAFSAYVINKGEKNIFTRTKNLYCVIYDEKNAVIKEKLVAVKNGTANNLFSIDSAFTSGFYKIRAFTNWMQNFDENNFFEENFRVVKEGDDLSTEKTNATYTLKVLPEGGHIVSNAINNLGIIVKDNYGNGLSYASGKILSNNGNTIAEFTLNEFGIQKSTLRPTEKESYKVILEKDSIYLENELSDIKDKGITIATTSIRDNFRIVLRTNKRTLKSIKEKNYELFIHNASNIKSFPIKFTGEEVLKIINKNDLFEGFNIITLFDLDKNTPILERQIFNDFSAKSRTSLAIINQSKEKDSIKITFKLKNSLDSLTKSNISISVLPTGTESYQFDSGILTKVFLESHIKGHIQNPNYYISLRNNEVKSNLDKLLLTQGWSSYSWKDIFSPKPLKYAFEDGLNTVFKTREKEETFFIHPLENNDSKIVTSDKTESIFSYNNLYPYEDEVLRISKINKKGNTRVPKIETETYPFDIPKPDFKYATKLRKFSSKNKEINTKIIEPFQGDFEELEGITITANVEEKRQEKIRLKLWGKVDFFDDRQTKGGYTMQAYLINKGFEAYQNVETGQFVVVNPNPSSPNNNQPLLIVDGVQQLNYDILNVLPMNIIDYIETSKNGAGYGMRAGGGVINIVTDPVKRSQEIGSKNRNQSFEYKFPLGFAREKKYYTPEYYSFDGPFFEKYGVVGWFPKNKVNEDGTFSITVPKHTKKINLYIEGIVNGNIFVSEKKQVTLF